MQKRKKFLKDFIPLVKNFYQKISGEDYEVDIIYESQLLNASFVDLLQQLRDKDLLLQRTHAGVHKDDLEINLRGIAFKIF